MYDTEEKEKQNDSESILRYTLGNKKIYKYFRLNDRWDSSL